MNKLGLALLLAFLGLAPAQAQLPLVFPAPSSAGSVMLTPSTTGTTGAVSATITGAPGKWTYICGFVVTSGGTTAASAVDVTITGVATTMNFIYSFVSSGQGILGVAIPGGCISSTAVNTSIAVNVPAGGAGTTVAVTAWGYLN